METIPLSECTKIGYLQKPHGVRGEIALAFDEEFEEPLESARELFVKVDGLLVPFFIEADGMLIKSGRLAHIKFRWIDSGEKAREFSGCEVYLKTEGLAAQPDGATIESLTGFMVIDGLRTQIGEVTGVNNYAGNVVLSVDYHGNEVLIPFNPEIVGLFDPDKKIVQLFIADGLLGLGND